MVQGAYTSRTPRKGEFHANSSTQHLLLAMCIFRYVYIHMYACTYVGVYICTYVCTYSCMHPYVIHIFMLTYICAFLDLPSIGESSEEPKS